MGKASIGVVRQIRPSLSPGDVLIDGGNSWFADTDRRMKELAGTGILHVGAGVSGGEEGVFHTRWKDDPPC